MTGFVGALLAITIAIATVAAFGPNVAVALAVGLLVGFCVGKLSMAPRR